MPNPIRFIFESTTAGLDSGVDHSERLVKKFADTAEKSGKRVDSAFESTAGHADNVASKGSQAAGGLSGLGSVALLAGGNVGKLGGAMVLAGTATQAAADAGDLLNVVTESTIVKKTLEKVATLGSAAATVASTAATKAATAGQWALNAALTANPVALIVIGVIALVAALILAYKRSETFRRIVNGVFGSVVGAAQRFAGFFTRTIPDAVARVIAFVRAHWPVILAIMAGPLGLAVLAVTRNLDRIKGLFNNVVGFVTGVPGRIGDLAGRFTDAGGRLIQGLFSGLSHIGGAELNFAEDIVNSAIDLLNRVLPHSISINKGFLHVSAPLFPTIPHVALASGGITTGPTFALIGDNPGGREAVIPLNGDNNPLGSRTYNIRVEVPLAHDLYTVGETIVEAIRAFEDGGGD